MPTNSKTFSLLLGSLFLSFTAFCTNLFSPKDFVFHKSPEANAEWKIVNNEILQATFVPDNPFNVSLWFSRLIADPIPASGQSYRVIVMVKQRGCTDPQARINLDVLGADSSGAYLNTSLFRRTVWAANCTDWTPVELIFSLPKAGIDEKWAQSKVFLTSFSALSSNGTFLFKDYKFEIIQSQPEQDE